VDNIKLSNAEPCYGDEQLTLFIMPHDVHSHRSTLTYVRRTVRRLATVTKCNNQIGLPETVTHDDVKHTHELF